ncbi:minor capsid protein [Microviridae sp.]|nr:minor capsid protein [Microviridae sp.]
MDPFVTGSLISAGSSLLGGLFGGGSSAKKQMRMQYDYQRKLNQTAVQDRVADATAAGVHPLYALGASLNPGGVSMPNEGPSLGDRLSDMGQNIGRAVMARQSKSERLLALKSAELDLEGKSLDNQVKRAQIASLMRSPSMPPATSVQGNGQVYVTDKGVMPSDNAGTELGEEPALKYVNLPGIGPVRVKGTSTEEALEDNHLANLGIDLAYFYPDIIRNVSSRITKTPVYKWLTKPTSEVFKSSGKKFGRSNRTGPYG